MKIGSSGLRYLLGYCLLSVIAFCGQVSAIASDSISAVSLRPQTGDSETLFESLPSSQTGVDFVNRLDPESPLSFLYHSGMSCGGVAIGDVNGDERPDIYLANGFSKNKLYTQSADDFVFEDATKISGAGGDGGWSTGVAIVDIDNDGDLDIYVCNYVSPNQLFINDGKGKFTDQAAAYKVDFVDASLMPSFADYDLDGDLDFYLVTNRWHDPEGFPKKSPAQVKNGRPSILPGLEKHYQITQYGYEPVGRPDRLLRNNGDGTFTDVTSEARISGRGDGLSATWWDYNDDGYPDIYVGNDFSIPDKLYRNNGDGTFTNVLDQLVPHSSWFSMGADVADINNDGLFDFLIGDMSSTTHFMEKTSMGAMSSKLFLVENSKPPQYMRNALYLNTGASRFMEAAYLTGLAKTDWTWSIKLADYDNDGWTDAFITNGAARNTTDSDFTSPNRNEVEGRHMWEFYRDTPPRREQNLAFRNNGDLQFEDVSESWGLDHLGMSYGSAYADIDRDGDLDLVTANLDEQVSLYRNNSREGNRLLISLHGVGSNRYGVGAKVELKTEAGSQVRQLNPTTGFLSSNEPTIHFGLGGSDIVQHLTVHWPSGRSQEYENLSANFHYTIVEPEENSIVKKSPEKELPMFVKSNALNGILHKEKDYDDYKRQPLLPYKLSQLGPGLTVGDVGGNGSEDIYVSGSAREAGVLFSKNKNGIYQFNTWDPFYDDRASEDMGSLFFDSDGDGDMDLYVVSGGVECEPGAEALRDRLYINEGLGIFSKAPEGHLPDLRDSGSVVTAADFDRDGDLDLFIGGRSIPGQYPRSPNSRLLRNDGGKFTDVTDKIPPGLRNAGLVTSALWTDTNNDGWIDLVVTAEWGPVKIFSNNEGLFSDSTNEAGLADHLGLWNGVTGRDIDNDGDIDYVVTNIGFNTKYVGTKEKPALLYYGEFDDSGNMRLIEAAYEDDTLYPIRGKSCSTNAMPSLAKKFTSYKAFASATLGDIYSPQSTDEALRLELNDLASSVLINDGNGKFKVEPLPRLVQISAGYGVVLTEINGDGMADLYLVQNFFSPQAETGRFDGGLSLLLTGNGDGTFTPVWPNKSGLMVPGDAKSLAVTDFNDDGWPDFAIGVNNGEMMAFENRGSGSNRIFTVRLEGKPGNPTGIGARVTVHLSNGTTQTAEVYAGGGYLSQSTPALTFGKGTTAEVEKVEVIWPDGRVHTTEIDPSSSKFFKIQYPEK